MPHEDPDRDDAYLWEMLTYSRELVEITDGRVREELASDRVFCLAVERLIEIIGEACRKVSRVTKRDHADIPWQGIQAQRHVLAHEYGKIDYDKIWRVATIHVPALIIMLEPIVPDAPPDPLPEPE